MGKHEIRCPNCGASDYTINYSTSTLIGWTPRYVDGVQVKKDPNRTTKHCTCFSCGSDFEYEVG